jgi:predicted Zn-dependent protease
MALAELLAEIPGRMDDAIEALRRAAAAGAPNAWNNLTVLLKQTGRTVEAEAAYQDAIAAGEGGLVAHYGQFLVSQGRIDDAERVLRPNLGRDPLCAYLLGAVFLDVPGRAEEGRALLRDAAGRGITEAALLLARS